MKQRKPARGRRQLTFARRALSQERSITMRLMLSGGIVLLFLSAFAFVRPELCRSADTEAGVIHLFNGKDLTNFYTYLAAPQGSKQRYGKNNDPEKVFTVHDGMVHVSGKVFGGFITEKEYENYHLVVEYKW